MIKKRDLTAAKVTAAALQIAADKGLAAVTLSSVARTLDIQPQSMYRYARNVHDLRGQVVASNLETMINQLYNELLGMPARAALELFAQDMVTGKFQRLHISDLGLDSTYRQHEQVAAQLTRFWTLSSNLVTAYVGDSAASQRWCRLLNDVIFGELALGGIPGEGDAAGAQADFSANVHAVLDLMQPAAQ